MNTFGLSNHLGRIKEPNTMSIWKEVVEEYLTVILTSAITLLHDSSSRTILTEQDNKNEDMMSDNYHIVMTILWQIIQNKLSLTDIE